MKGSEVRLGNEWLEDHWPQTVTTSTNVYTVFRCQTYLEHLNRGFYKSFALITKLSHHTPNKYTALDTLVSLSHFLLFLRKDDDYTFLWNEDEIQERAK